MDVFVQEIRAGITRTEEFEKKGLASFAVNAGLKCGHGCLYCSTPSMVRCHQAFQTIGRSAFEDGFAVVDPGVVERVARDAARKRNRGMIQMGTTTDFYSPEARQHNLGREVLEAILAQPGWSIRILTKSHHVRDDFDLIERHRDRIVVGISLTALPASQAIISIIEPHASTIAERQATLVEAHERGIRTFGMLCPLLPGISDDAQSVGQLVQFCESIEAEQIFAEPMNKRGRARPSIEEAMRANGYTAEAQAMADIRSDEVHGEYARRLLGTMQAAMSQYSSIDKLKFLLYQSTLSEEVVAAIRGDDRGVVWL